MKSILGSLGHPQKSILGSLGLPQKYILGFLGLTHFLQSSSVSQVFQEI